ncbi:MAG: hypothetical protein NZ481_06455 [Candidatus Kapabacteria bacterium]|nr:hypothetical protein [Candidatus Kapabacteria bacterium]MCX7937700.1 hypothetical protein [Chlorobiota bacterium]
MTLRIIWTVIVALNIVHAQVFKSCVVFFIGKLHFFSCQNTEINFYAELYRKQSPPRRTIMSVALDNERELALLKAQSAWFAVDTIIPDMYRSLSRRYNVGTYPSMIEFDETGAEILRGVGLHFVQRIPTKQVCDSIVATLQAHRQELGIEAGRIISSVLWKGYVWTLDPWMSAITKIDIASKTERVYPISPTDSYRFLEQTDPTRAAALRRQKIYPLALFALASAENDAPLLCLSAVKEFDGNLAEYGYYLVPVNDSIEWKNAFFLSPSDTLTKFAYEHFYYAPPWIITTGKRYTESATESVPIIAIFDRASRLPPNVIEVQSPSPNEKLILLRHSSSGVVFYSQASASLFRFDLSSGGTPTYLKLGRPFSKGPEERWICIGGSMRGDTCILVHVRVTDSQDTPPTLAHRAVVCQYYDWASREGGYLFVTPCLVDDELQNVQYCGISNATMALLYQWKRKPVELWQIPLSRIFTLSTKQ